MRKILFFFAITLMLSVTVFAQADKAVKTPVIKNPLAVEAMWDLLNTIDLTAATGAAGNAGAEYANGYYYSTRWATNLIHEVDAAGTVIREFSIPGVSGLRDLAYDGTYFYGGASGAIIYQMDFATETLIGTIPVGGGVTVRNCAYDSDNDAFWVSNWSTAFALVDRTGATLATWGPSVTFTSNYGSAYDNITQPGTPYLWVFSQAGSGGEIHQVEVPAGVETGVFHDVIPDFGSSGDIAGGLWTSTDHTAGFQVIGGLLQGVPDQAFAYELSPAGPPVGPGPATNPNPAHNATGVGLDDDLFWDNAPGATEIEIFWNGTSVYVGTPVTTYDPGTLDWLTTYSWKVNQTDATGTTFGPTWAFTTMQDPLFQTIFTEDFESGAGWTIDNLGGACVWEILPFDPGRYQTPNGSGNHLVADSDLCGSGTTMNTTATQDVGVNLDPALWYGVVLSFDHDYNFLGTSGEYAEVQWSNDGGATWNVLVTYTTDVRGEHAEFAIPDADLSTDFRLKFVYVAPGWDWWWSIDNVVYEGSIIIVELTGFSANVANGSVQLNWATATETNNSHFVVERSADNEAFAQIGLVDGMGTTAEPQTYSYSDNTVSGGSYYYRLKQVDFSGAFEYSNTVEVLVLTEFGLEQNYPNPFNPSTTIKFSLPSDAKVSVKLYNTLGQEVAQLLNTNYTAGIHEFDFNAANFSSGVYFYTLEAKGVDGQNFVSTKKMMLMK